jgi:amino acid transporter
VDYPALEHRTTRPGRWLRERRLRVALWIAVAEGILVVFDVIAGWTALLVGAVIVAFYFALGRRLPNDTARELSWTAATSQVLVAFVPVLAFVLGVLAVIALVLIAVVALVALLADRR